MTGITDEGQVAGEELNGEFHSNHVEEKDDTKLLLKSLGIMLLLKLI